LGALVGVYAWMLAAAFSGGATNIPRTLLLGADRAGLLHDLLVRFGAVSCERVVAGAYWRLGAAMFVHIGLIHLLFNGWALYHLGMAVERHLGPPKFLLVYLGAGVSGSAWSINMQAPAVMTAGASGALFGLAGALLAFVLRNRRTMPGVIYRPYVRRLGVLIVFGIGLGLVLPNIDNWAHLGGLSTGFVLGLVLSREVAVTRRFTGGQVVGAAIVLVLVGWLAVWPAAFGGGVRSMLSAGPLKRLVLSEQAEARAYHDRVIRRLDWLDRRFGQMRERLILPRLDASAPGDDPDLAGALAVGRDFADRALTLLRRDVPRLAALRELHDEARQYFGVQKAYTEAVERALHTGADPDWARVIEAGDDLLKATSRWRAARRRFAPLWEGPDAPSGRATP